MKNLNLNTFSIKLFSALFEFWIVWLARGVLEGYFKICGDDYDDYDDDYDDDDDDDDDDVKGEVEL